jgi:paraquat-inducible protein A
MVDHQPMTLRGCACCGLVQQVPMVAVGHVARCARCEHVIHRPGGSAANRLTAAVALAALVLLPFGVLLPVLKLEQLGHMHEASIWYGTLSLLSHGQVAVGLVVLICSVVLPTLKLVGLFLLTAPTPWLARRHQTRIYHLVEFAGRWGMIDVLLVALLVAAVKVGDMVNVSPGPGVAAFTLVVVLSLIASMTFDPHAIWESQRT